MTNTENTISRYDFEAAVEDVYYSSITEDYSGRAMFGRTCIGLILEPREVDKVAVELTRAAERLREQIEEDEDPDLEWDAEEELAEKLESMSGDVSFDNMGLDAIVYFPRWSFED